MFKTLMGLAIAGAAALAIASPAAAAPVCHDDSVIAYGGSFPTYAGYGLFTSDFCDGAYDIVSIDYSVGSGWIYNQSGSYAYIDGLWLSPETAVVTVTDGTDTDTFTLTLTPCYSGWSC